MKKMSRTVLMTVFSMVLSANAFAAGEHKHFHPKGKVPSKYTVEKQQTLRKALPFEDKQDFEENKRGFIAAPPYDQIMAEAGHVLMATDSHRSSRWWHGFLSGQGLEPIDPVELVDVARGKEECTDFYRMWVNYFSALKQETLMAHLRIGEATVPEIVEELRKSTNKNMLFKLGLAKSGAFSNPGIFVAEILAENRTLRWIDGERMLFVPSEKWNFLKE